MKVLKVWEKGFNEEFKALQFRSLESKENLEALVREIIKEVKKRGDQALIEYAATFDKVNISQKELQVSEAEIEKAWERVPSKNKEALILAKERIERYHREEVSRSWLICRTEGEIIGKVVIPLEKVGIYVPGGKASYPSSVLMNAIPARVAGVSEIIMVTPPAMKTDNLYTLAVARLCKIKKVYRIGGAQAIAALTYGTETIPRVDKIVGPGNIFVTMAKKLVAGEVGIDMLAGPSEILIIADKSAKPEFIAADLLSQAEHDEEARVILITPEENIASQVQEEIKIQMKSLPRREILSTALKRHGCIVITNSLIQSIELANKIAPEHLLLAVEEPFSLLGEVKNAGAVFLGHFSPVAAGDYLAGPNHVLPTSGNARFSSPLGIYDFFKYFSFTHFNQDQLKKLGAEIMRLARLEGLEAHARSIELRLE